MQLARPTSDMRRFIDPSFSPPLLTVGSIYDTCCEIIQLIKFSVRKDKRTKTFQAACCAVIKEGVCHRCSSGGEQHLCNSPLAGVTSSADLPSAAPQLMTPRLEKLERAEMVKDKMEEEEVETLALVKESLLAELEVEAQMGGIPILSNEGGMPPSTRQNSSQEATAQFGLSPISDVMQYMHMYDD